MMWTKTAYATICSVSSGTSLSGAGETNGRDSVQPEFIASLPSEFIRNGFVVSRPSQTRREARPVCATFSSLHMTCRPNVTGVKLRYSHSPHMSLGDSTAPKTVARRRIDVDMVTEP